MPRAVFLLGLLMGPLIILAMPSVVAQAPPSLEAEATSPVGQVVSYVGISLAFGAVALLLVDRAAAQRTVVLRTGLRAGVVAYAVGAALTWSATGAMVPLLVGLAALVVLTLAVTTGGLHLDVAAAAVLLGAVAHRGVTGHAAAFGLTGLTFHASHMVAVTAWLGALILLLATVVMASRLGMDVEATRAFGLRFSNLALVLVVLMAMTGVFLAILLLGRPQVLDVPRMLSSDYGRVLYAKVLLALGMVAVAGVNRYVFLEHDDGSPWMRGWRSFWRTVSGGRVRPMRQPEERRALAWFVAAEVVMGLAVLSLSAVLTMIVVPTP